VLHAVRKFEFLFLCLYFKKKNNIFRDFFALNEKSCGIIILADLIRLTFHYLYGGRAELLGTFSFHHFLSEL